MTYRGSQKNSQVWCVHGDTIFKLFLLEMFQTREVEAVAVLADLPVDCHYQVLALFQATDMAGYSAS